MEPAFTEQQWRAVEYVEHNTKYWASSLFLLERKPAIAPHLRAGSYYLASQHRGGMLQYIVVEWQSGLVLSRGMPTAGQALNQARLVLNRVPPEYFESMLASARGVHATRIEELVRLEADRAAKTARAAKRKAHVPKRRRLIFEASDGKCHYCQTVLDLTGRWHIEHKMPRALLGGNEPDNLVASCAPCNHAKRDRTDLEFMAMARH